MFLAQEDAAVGDGAVEGDAEFTLLSMSRCWEFPLSRAEKVERAFKLFDEEIDRHAQDHEDLKKENDALRRENANLRQAIQKLACSGDLMQPREPACAPIPEGRSEDLPGHVVSSQCSSQPKL